MANTDDRTTSNDLIDLLDHELWRLIDAQPTMIGVFRPTGISSEMLARHPALDRLRDMRLIQSVPVLPDRYVTQVVRLNRDGRFPFLIIQLSSTLPWPFLSVEETSTDETYQLRYLTAQVTHPNRDQVDRLLPPARAVRNYMPVRVDLADTVMVEVITYLREHDDLARAIGARGGELAESLAYDGEVERALPVLRRCPAANREVSQHVREAVAISSAETGRGHRER